MALKVGMVGFRGIANSHAPHYAETDLGDLVAICDVVPQRAKDAAAKYGCNAYESLAQMLANEELDVIDVCTGGYENGSWHYEPVMEALAAGKHVLCEKPLSSNLDEAREMVIEADRQKRYLGCNLNHYFTDIAARGRQYIDDGAVGEHVYCLMKMGFHGGDTGSYKAPKGIKTAGFPYWHLKAFLSHPFSVMKYFCGDITHVQAFISQPGFRRSAGDVMLTSAGINVRFANGSMGYLLSQRGDAPYGLGGWWSCEVAGTKGTFVLENCVEKISYWKVPRGGGPGKAEVPADEVTDTGTTDFGLTFKHRIHAFLEDVTNGVPRDRIRASGLCALACLEYTYAAMESYELGGEMVRPNPLPAIHQEPEDIPE